MFRKEKWEFKRLGEITTLRYGKNLTDKMRNSGDVPVYGSAGIVGWHNKSITDSLTVIIARKGSVGNIFISENPCFPIDTTFYIDQSSCELNLRWLYIFLLGSDLKRLNMATAVPGINRGIIQNIQIPLPPLEEQKQLVELFQVIDQAIGQINEQESKILDFKKYLLLDLFTGRKHFAHLISKNDCELFKFEELAIQVSERVDPNKTDLKIYVGLEHLKSDNLMIEKTGSPDEVVGIKLKVSQGDIIFGKRRAYLRKVAVSHFNGIASAHSMILRANEKKIEKDFLPYFMQSDEFMNRAVQISEGSLSPTIKWKTLAAQEFVLPQKDKQPQLIGLFDQFDETIVLLRKQKTNLKKLKQQLLNEILG